MYVGPPYCTGGRWLSQGLTGGSLSLFFGGGDVGWQFL